jgi:methyl-accepting chemotaxis protein
MRVAMEAQAATVTAISAAVDETAQAAVSSADTLAAIQSETERLAREIGAVDGDMGAIRTRLDRLRGAAEEYLATVA